MAAPSQQLPAVVEGRELSAAARLSSPETIAQEQLQQEQQALDGQEQRHRQLAAEKRSEQGWKYRFNNPQQVCLTACIFCTQIQHYSSPSATSHGGLACRSSRGTTGLSE